MLPVSGPGRSQAFSYQNLINAETILGVNVGQHSPVLVSCPRSDLDADGVASEVSEALCGLC